MDSTAIEDWLNARPREDVILIAQRSALRMWPLFSVDAREEWVRERGSKKVMVLRCLLTSGVARRYPAREARHAAFESFGGVMLARGTGAAANAGHAAKLAALASTTEGFAPSFEVVATASRFGEAYNGKCMERDVSILAAGYDLLATSIWHEALPERLQVLETKALAVLAGETGDPNSFWHRWYSSARDGNWMDWDMQRDIALIPDEVWTQGHKAVAAAIAVIEARHDLRRQVAVLRSELAALSAQTTASVLHRSHNHPPELIDASMGVRQQIAAMAEDLAATEEELAKPSPDKPRLRVLAEKLGGAAFAVLSYCGRLADTFLQASAKSAGDKAGIAFVVYVGAEPVIKGITSFAESLLTYARLP